MWYFESNFRGKQGYSGFGFPELLRFQRADLYLVKGRHKACGDLCRFLFSDGVGGILLSGFEKVFQRTAVLGRASVSEQLN